MTAAWRFYDVATGVFAPQAMLLPTAAAVEANTPAGHAALWGEVDHLAQRVDVDAATDPPTLVAYQPPAPASTDRLTWQWEPEDWRWVGVPTNAALADQVRAERDLRLADSDWVVLRAMEQGTPVPAAWSAYRAALRDLPGQVGFPTAIAWPAAPA